MKCPNCNAQSDGAFCSSCGTPLKGAKCKDCGAALVAGARFCNNCGTAVGARSTDGGNLPWIVAGIALAALIIVLAWPALSGGGDRAQSDGRMPVDQLDGGTSTPPPGPGPLSGTPREQADRLFNRIMTERETGDTAQARFFLPMALQAYANAEPLDADGYYHLSLLQSYGGDHGAALASAQRILATQPNHLLGLGAAASAARAAGDNAAARNYNRQLLAAYEREIATTKPEYQDHANILPELKAQAEAFR